MTRSPSAKTSSGCDGAVWSMAPSIEINGEFEVDSDINWDELMEDRPMIPREQGPEMSRLFVWALVVAAVVLFYLVFLRH